MYTAPTSSAAPLAFRIAQRAAVAAWFARFAFYNAHQLTGAAPDAATADVVTAVVGVDAAVYAVMALAAAAGGGAALFLAGATNPHRSILGSALLLVLLGCLLVAELFSAKVVFSDRAATLGCLFGLILIGLERDSFFVDLAWALGDSGDSYRFDDDA